MYGRSPIGPEGCVPSRRLRHYCGSELNKLVFAELKRNKDIPNLKDNYLESQHTDRLWIFAIKTCDYKFDSSMDRFAVS